MNSENNIHSCRFFWVAFSLLWTALPVIIFGCEGLVEVALNNKFLFIAWLLIELISMTSVVRYTNMLKE